MDVQVAVIGLIGTIILSITGFITVMYQVIQGRKENVSDHGQVMAEIVSVAKTLGGVEQDMRVVGKKLDRHIKEHKDV